MMHSELKTTLRFMLTMLAAFIVGWLAMLALLRSRW